MIGNEFRRIALAQGLWRDVPSMWLPRAETEEPDETAHPGVQQQDKPAMAIQQDHSA